MLFFTRISQGTRTFSHLFHWLSGTLLPKRENDSLVQYRTGGLLQHQSYLYGSKMSVMQDKDAAYSPPDGDDLSRWNKSTLYGTQSITNPTQQRVGKQGSSQCILVVEDDASLANLEAGILAAHGYAVAIAHSGEMAIAALQQALPDLVLLDLDLSGTTNGWDVLQMLRSYSATPVLLTSSESAVNRQIRIRGETRSTLDHLPKPYLMQTLLKRIERMLAIGPY